MTSKASTYHHGDLRSKLIETTAEMIQQGGVEAVSLRKIAEKAGVSRSAPYHHFKDKNDLLAAVAEQGFITLTGLLKKTVQNEALSLDERLEQSIFGYVRFAVENATQYELMFGSELWRKNPSERLQRTAKDSFRQYANLIGAFYEQGVLHKDQHPLRLAQMMWATLHGLVKLSHDGIVVRQEDLEEISRYAITQLTRMMNG
ncbi:TetR/AcrR family transcriptional regulator [Alkalimarinus coralli]|uniref:TetR/AcrR family transcriptional regulator n=1 Tax=Alkalimarinus coralli TaxID=2935863 RepID=UPI00202B0851|nr:TetR/AcrR family transcriptional regulator [Alkalimarinus coralli]